MTPLPKPEHITVQINKAIDRYYSKHHKKPNVLYLGSDDAKELLDHISHVYNSYMGGRVKAFEKKYMGLPILIVDRITYCEVGLCDEV